MDKFIDIHCHLAYGIDDGAKTLNIAKKMLMHAYIQGVRVIIATPHVEPGVKPFDNEEYEKRLNILRSHCEEKKYPIVILSGAEIMYTDAVIRFLQAGSVPTIGDSQFILVEWYPSVSFDVFEDAVKKLSNAGYTTIVAHIERYRCLWRKVRMLAKMKEMYDLRFQVDNEAFLQKGPFLMNRFVESLVTRDLIDYVASDAHDTKHFDICMDEVYEYLKDAYGKEYANALTWENQLEILSEIH